MAAQKIRQGNDIDIRWSLIDSEEQPYIIEGKDIRIELNVGPRKVRITEFEVSGNTVHFVYYGKEQRYLGAYILKYIENEGKPNMVTFDIKDAFTLVEHSWQAVDAGETPETIQLEFVTISSNLLERVGPAAGFGEVTAEVDANTGIPSIEVETSGPNSAKKFHFAFHNLKGEQGMQGEPGADGADGADGVTPHIGANGDWFIGDTDTGVHAQGEQGPQGTEGPVGPAGSDADVTSENIRRALGYVPYNKPQAGIPATDLAQGVIPDVSQFITNSVDNLVNYYLKSETYTKDEVAALIGAINQFHYEIAARTSDVTNPQSNVLYLIGPTGSGADKYEEYVYPDAVTGWVKIGDTSIDLSGYITTSALNTALADYTTTANLTTLLAAKYEKPSSGIPESDLFPAVASKLNIWAKGSGTNSALLGGSGSTASGSNSVAEGFESGAIGNYSHAEGRKSTANGVSSHTEGYNTETGGDYASNTKQADASEAAGKYAHAEGNAAIAKGMDSHAEGRLTFAEGKYSHSEGFSTEARGNASHAEAFKTLAQGNNSHAEGYQTQALNSGAHSEGYKSVAGGSAGAQPSLPTPSSDTIGNYTHAEGNGTVAYGANSHSEGKNTFAGGLTSHAEGSHTETQNEGEHAQGQYNKSNKAAATFGDAGNTIHSIGIGTGANDRKNAVEVMQNGDIYIIGIGGYDGTNPSSASSLQDILRLIA